MEWRIKQMKRWKKKTSYVKSGLLWGRRSLHVLNAIKHILALLRRVATAHYSERIARRCFLFLCAATARRGEGRGHHGGLGGGRRHGAAAGRKLVGQTCPGSFLGEVHLMGSEDMKKINSVKKCRG